MKTVVAIVIVAIALVLGGCRAQSASPTSSPPTHAATVGPSTPTHPDDPLAATAWEALMSSDGEYAASAAYQAVIETYGEVEPYVSIQSAEERHIQALTRQLVRLGVAVPLNPYVGTIPAPADLTGAANAWATAEVANVAMYDRLLADTQSDGALTRVLTNLRRAAKDVHLPAFRAAAENGGQLSIEQMRALGLG